MSSFTASVRFLAGMGLLAGGAILVHPVAEGLLRTTPPAPVPALADVRARDEQRATATTGAPPTDEILSVPSGIFEGPIMPPADAPAFPVADGAGLPSAAPYVPPPVPAPLPRADLVATAPDLAYAYRSTVDIPPPALLDTQAPPPLGLTWETHAGARSPALAGGPGPAPVPATVPADAWGMRIVRDGDDLTSIALEVYGHAAAAAAIREANADAIADPQVLPIGLVLRLPPSWTLPSTPAARGPAAIEPSKRGGNGGAAAASGAESPPPVPVPWLATPEAAPALIPPIPSPGAAVTTPATDAPSADHAAAGRSPTPRPASVRAAPGDTLETIAERFYGDRSAARRIWLANRDRLRSPALVVPGMEISLP